MNSVDKRLLDMLERYIASGIEQQVDYEKFYLYSLITHSTAIEGSTITEVENQLLFDEGIVAKGRSINEQMMNVDLRDAYIYGFEWAGKMQPYTVDFLRQLSAMVMRRTGAKYSVIGGEFDSSQGDFRLCNVSAGVGGSSYLAFSKVSKAVADFCEWLNAQFATINRNDVAACYRLSFEAHFRLVTIHPWVDGNGRTTRLLMNIVQRQLGLIPSIVSKENKGAYIQALIDSREAEDIAIIEDVMMSQHIENLESRILQYQKSLSDTVNNIVNDTVNHKQQQLLVLISEQPHATYDEYAMQLGVSRATVARNIKSFIAKGLIKRIGSDKNGFWEIIII